MTPVAMFLQNPGKPYVEFSIWFESFITYLEASGLTDVDEPRKARILRHYLCDEGVGLFRTCPEPRVCWRK